jgi:tRNA threonylcarbamoyladenosine biosynthesis protein TsaE
MTEILGTSQTLALLWPNEAATAAAAQRLAQPALAPLLGQSLIALEGGLGAGKTTFTRYLLRALGVVGRIKSPSYAVLESYELPACWVHHFDFYRFSQAREWEDAGFRELLAGPGLKLCEWPQNAAALLPLADLHLRFEMPDNDDHARNVLATAATHAGQRLLEALA